MDKQILEGQVRTISGRKVKKLREGDQLPANVYGKKIKSLAVQVKLSDFKKVFSEVGETGLITLKLQGDKAKEDRAVLVSNVQYNPVSDTPIHVDFRQVDLKEKVSASVAVEMAGEAPAEKSGVGTAVQYIDEVEVEALPGDLPEKFVVDISNLAEVDQTIKVGDLSYDKAKVEVKADPEGIIAKVEPPQKEEEIAPPVEAAPEGGEVPAEGAPVAEGETPAETETPKEEEKPQG